jgi:hypothetical protein
VTNEEKLFELPGDVIRSDERAAFVIARRSYVSGQDRNEPDAVAHLYRGTFRKFGSPMCRRGWNRLGGHGYSIFRNNLGGGLCKVCLRRARAKLKPMREVDRNTKWL